MFLCVLAIFWKVANLHITERDFLQDQGDRRTIRTVPLVANRGLITDRNGEPLAVSTPVQSIWVDPSKISDDPEDIKALAKNLELNEEVLIQNLKLKSNLKIHYIKRRLSPTEAEKIMRNWADGKDVRLITIHPSIVFGPILHRRHLEGSMSYLKHFASGSRFVLNIHINFVDVSRGII